MRIGLVGYGAGGRHFHAAFIVAAKGVELASVVARATRTVAEGAQVVQAIHGFLSHSPGPTL